MNYQHIARLAELADRINTAVAVDCTYLWTGPNITLAIYSGDADFITGAAYFDTKGLCGQQYTTEELIQILEQIERYGFREQEQAA